MILFVGSEAMYADLGHFSQRSIQVRDEYLTTYIVHNNNVHMIFSDAPYVYPLLLNLPSAALCLVVPSNFISPIICLFPL